MNWETEKLSDSLYRSIRFIAAAKHKLHCPQGVPVCK